MSNKITGIDLEKLINEAMGLKVESKKKKTSKFEPVFPEADPYEPEFDIQPPAFDPATMPSYAGTREYKEAFKQKLLSILKGPDVGTKAWKPPTEPVVKPIGDPENFKYFKLLSTYANARTPAPFSFEIDPDKYYYEFGQDLNAKKAVKTSTKKTDFGGGVKESLPTSIKFVSISKDKFTKFLMEKRPILYKYMRNNGVELLGDHEFLTSFLVASKPIPPAVFKRASVTSPDFKQVFNNIDMSGLISNGVIDIGKTRDRLDAADSSGDLSKIPSSLIYYLPYIAKISEPRNVLSDTDLIKYLTTSPQDVNNLMPTGQGVRSHYIYSYGDTYGQALRSISPATSLKSSAAAAGLAESKDGAKRLTHQVIHPIVIQAIKDGFDRFMDQLNREIVPDTKLQTGDKTANDEKRRKINSIMGMYSKLKGQDTAGRIDLETGAKINRDTSKVFRPRAEMSQAFRSYGGIGATPDYVVNIFENSSFYLKNSIRERLEGLYEFSKKLFGGEYQSRIQLQESLTTSAGTINVGEQFSNIMVLDYFKNFPNDYGMGGLTGATKGGFMFESFLALLLGGTVEGGSANVEDIILSSVQGKPPNGPNFISAKLISETTEVSQAGKTVQNFFAKHGQNAEFTYIVAYKVSKGYKDVEQKDSTTGEVKKVSFVEVPLFLKTFKATDFPKIEDGKVDGNGVKFFDPKQQIGKGAPRFTRAGYDYKEDPKFLKDKSDIVKKGQSSGTYIFDSKVIRNNANFIGSVILPMSDTFFDQVLSDEMDKLELNIKQVYNQLAEFEASMKSFYSAKDKVKMKEFGNEAMSAYNLLSKEVGGSIATRFVGTSDRTVSKKERFKTKKTFKGQDVLTSDDFSVKSESKITANLLKKLIEESFKR